MPAAWRRESARVLVDEVLGRLQGADVYRVLVDVLESLAHALGRLQVAAIFWPVQASQNCHGQDVFNGLGPDPWKDVNFQVPYDLLGIALGLDTIHLGASMPGARKPFEGVELGEACLCLLALSGFLRVSSIGTLAIRLIRFGACLCQRHLGVWPHAELDWDVTARLGTLSVRFLA